MFEKAPKENINEKKSIFEPTNQLLILFIFVITAIIGVSFFYRELKKTDNKQK
jgi:hypothetical protein